jgi:ParB/RepB/Spo0J family partition protein
MEEMESASAEISNVLVSEIAPDPRVPNPRGPIFDTTSLQPSIQTDGIKRPLWVRPAENGDGGYWLIDGYRRWTAARAVGVEVVPAEVHDVDDGQVRRLQMLANQQENLPFIVMNKDDEIIGGTCVIVCHEKQENKAKNYELAAYLGVTSDTIGALYRLCSEPPDVQRLVADKGPNGTPKMAITVYSKIKTAPPEMKAYIVAQVKAQKIKGQITARYVLDLMKKWDDIEGGLSENEPDESDLEVSDQPVEAENFDPEPEHPASYHLGQALVAVKKIEGPVEPYEMHLVHAIQKRLEMFDG